jgi:hypothetical protein
MSELDGTALSFRSRFSRSARFRIVALAMVVAAVALITLLIRFHENEASPKIAIQPPVATTLSWFAAINAHDKPLAVAHFVPADRDMMEWSNWGEPFRDIHCSLMNSATSRASVYCKFNDINDANMGMSNVSFWTVSLQREPSGRWLINNYGQG